MSIRFARHQAEKLIDELGIDTVPIDVEAIAGALGLTIFYKDLERSDVSAVLIADGDCASILINKDHAVVRQRFSIAHEIGHHVLGHQFEEGEHVHVDRGHMVSFRGPRASTGENLREVEANQFAASLLMPRKLLEEC